MREEKRKREESAEQEKKREEKRPRNEPTKKEETRTEKARRERANFPWYKKEVKDLTIRITDKEPGKKLTNEDLVYIQRKHVEAYTKMYMSDPEGFSDIGARVNIRIGGYDGIALKIKMDSLEGVTWMEQLVPQIPPMADGRLGYKFYPPGTKSTFQYRLFVTDCLAGGNKDLDKIFKTAIECSNPWTRGPGFFDLHFKAKDEKSRTKGVVWGLEVDDIMNEKLIGNNYELNYGFGPLIAREIKERQEMEDEPMEAEEAGGKGEKEKRNGEPKEQEEQNEEEWAKEREAMRTSGNNISDSEEEIENNTGK